MPRVSLNGDELLFFIIERLTHRCCENLVRASHSPVAGLLKIVLRLCRDAENSLLHQSEHFRVTHRYIYINSHIYIYILYAVVNLLAYDMQLMRWSITGRLEGRGISKPRRDGEICQQEQQTIANDTFSCPRYSGTI